MHIGYRLGAQRGERSMNRNRVPTLTLYIEEIDREYRIDLEELAEALEPYLHRTFVSAEKRGRG